jgi:hypothetical protein
VIARILIWNLAESMTTIEEIRANLPELSDGDRWISHDAAERFGLIAFGDELPDLGDVPSLIGTEPDIAEEFDVE